MPRTYSNTPEPRYVEKAKSVEGGGDFIVHAEILLLEGDPTAQITETAAEIKAAVDASKNIVCHYIFDNEGIPEGADPYYHNVPMARYSVVGDDITVVFVTPVSLNVRTSRTDVYQYEFGYNDNVPFAVEIETAFANYA